ncbi:MAG: MFS transporter [Lentisphaerae bacterium]|nr:MFS transporter [Lentisphaerota bacterium]
MNAACSLTDAQRRQGMRMVYCSQAIGVHLQMMIAFSAVGPLFIKQLGGSDLQAMLPSVMNSLLILLQIPLSLFVRPVRWKTTLVGCWFLSSFPMLAGIAAPWLVAGPAVVWAVLGSMILMLTLLNAGSAFWFPLLHDVIPDDQRGRFFGRMRALWSLALFGVSILCGLFLGQNPPVWKFQVVLGLLTLLQFAREPFVSRIPETAGKAREAMCDWADVRRIVTGKPLLKFCGYYMFLIFLVGFLGQPLVLYMKHLGFSARDNTIIFAASTLGGVAALLAAGGWIDRLGARKVLAGVHIVMSVLALLAAAAGGLSMNMARPLMTGVLILSGAALSAGKLANTAQIFQMAPVQGKAFFMCLAMGVFSAAAALSPLAAGWILDSRLAQTSFAPGGLGFDIYQVMFVLAGLFLLISIPLVRVVPDVRQASDVTVDEAKFV